MNYNLYTFLIIWNKNNKIEHEVSAIDKDQAWEKIETYWKDFQDKYSVNIKSINITLLS